MVCILPTLSFGLVRECTDSLSGDGISSKQAITNGLQQVFSTCNNDERGRLEVFVVFHYLTLNYFFFLARARVCTRVCGRILNVQPLPFDWWFTAWTLSLHSSHPEWVLQVEPCWSDRLWRATPVSFKFIKTCLKNPLLKLAHPVMCHLSKLPRLHSHADEWRPQLYTCCSGC